MLEKTIFFCCTNIEIKLVCFFILHFIISCEVFSRILSEVQVHKGEDLKLLQLRTISLKLL